jgi:hypothetical protein
MLKLRNVPNHLQEINTKTAKQQGLLAGQDLDPKSTSHHLKNNIKYRETLEKLPQPPFPRSISKSLLSSSQSFRRFL